jgi:HEAT repeat protein
VSRPIPRNHLLAAGIALASVTLCAVWLRASLAFPRGGRVITVLSELESASEGTRATARAYLEQVGTSVLPQLLALLSSRDSAARRWAFRVFNTKLLHELGVYSASERRDLAFKGFRVLGPAAEPAVPALADLLTNAPTAADGALCLAVVGTSSVPVLLGAMDAPDPVVRSRAAAALGAITPRPTSAIPQLIKALADRQRVVRSCAACSLGAIRAEPNVVIPPLIHLLKDPEPLVRRFAIHGIEAYGPEAAFAVPALLDVSSDPDPLVRSAAQAAIERLREERGRSRPPPPENNGSQREP